MQKKYDVIYSDPAWKYGSSQKMHKQVGEVYNTMKLSAMQSFRIQSICHPWTLMFMWTTGPKMNEAMRLLYQWNFEYKTMAFVWKKGTHKNMGSVTMSQCEYLLVAKNMAHKPKDYGSPVKPINFATPQFHNIPRPRGHSSKPDDFNHLIKGIYGNRTHSHTNSKGTQFHGVPRDLEYCELFARRFISGWDCVGDSINGTIQDFLAGKNIGPLR